MRKATKEALAEAKGDRSYDEVLRTMLEMVPLDEVRRQMERRREDDARAMRLRMESMERLRRGLERSPEKQVLIADLARQRWKRWVQEGRVKELGPRLVAWNRKAAATSSEPRAGVKLAWQPGRGLPPGEGAGEP